MCGHNRFAIIVVFPFGISFFFFFTRTCTANNSNSIAETKLSHSGLASTLRRKKKKVKKKHVLKRVHPLRQGIMVNQS